MTGLGRAQRSEHGRDATRRSSWEQPYDRLGNLTQRGSATTTYQPSQPHWIDTVGDNGYQYDANGDVAQRSGPDIPGGIQTLEYTPFDLPSTVIQGQTNVVKTTRFDYSADEERVARRDADTTRYFVADLYQRLIENTSGSTLEERFRLYAGSRSLGEIVRKSGSADQTLFFHTDQLDSVDTVSTDTGEVFRQEFDAFGMPIDATSTELTRAGFTGHQHDQDLGLIDMKGRVYDPLAGRFTSADPVTQAPFWTQGLNRYSYVFNDPINHTDPSGFFAIVPGYPAGAVITGSPLGLVGVGVDIGLSLALGMPSSLGSTGSVTLGSVAPTTSAATQGGTHAALNNKGGVNSGVRQLDDRSRLAGVEYAIDRALNEGNIDRAIEIGRGFWEIDSSIPIHYDDSLRDQWGRQMYGITEYWPENARIEITLGRCAITDPRSLLSTLYHEGGPSISHVAQARDMPLNWAEPGRDAAAAVNELQAYRAERVISSRLGLEEGHVRAIDQGIGRGESVIKGTDYASRVKANNYRLFRSDVIVH